jgi:hypothetical protein
MTSAPRARLVQRLFPENENRLVVQNPLAAQNIIAMAGVGIERDIGNEAEIWHCSARH